MSDKGKLQACANRASKMKDWAEGPDGFFDMLGALEHGWLQEWAKTAPEDIERRESLYALVKSLHAINSMMTSVIAEGKFSEAELKKLRAYETGEVRSFH